MHRPNHREMCRCTPERALELLERWTALALEGDLHAIRTVGEAIEHWLIRRAAALAQAAPHGDGIHECGGCGGVVVDVGGSRFDWALFPDPLRFHTCPLRGRSR